MSIKLSIKKKLGLFSAAGMVFVAVLGGNGLYVTKTLEDSIVSVKGVAETLKDQLEADQMHDTLRGDVLSALLASQSGDVTSRDEVMKDVKEHTENFKRTIKELKAESASEDVQKAISKTEPTMETYLKEVESITALAFSDPKAANNQYPKFMVAFKALEKEMASLSDLIDQQAKLEQDMSSAVVSKAYVHASIIALFSAIGLFLIGWVISRSIVKPINDAIGVAETIATGDLTTSTQVDRDDATETGRLRLALVAMNESLLKIVREVRQGTDAILTASTQIAAGNLDLSQRTEEQASSLEETASSMQQIASTVKHSADSSRQASDLAGTATNVASKGGEVVKQVVSKMGSISGSANEIAGIIGVIDGIAFQTNILALNAAVEAARAGEQGRGFAVVATEVRALAQRSAAAAKEIKELISRSVEEVGSGTKLVNEAGNTIDEIVEGVKRVSSLISEVAQASREQSGGIDQINRAVEQMEAVTQQNAALVEESSAASEALRAQAVKLSEVVSVFKTGADNQVSLTAPSGKKVKMQEKKQANGSPTISKESLKAHVVVKRESKSKDGDEWEEF